MLRLEDSNLTVISKRGWELSSENDGSSRGKSFKNILKSAIIVFILILWLEFLRSTKPVHSPTIPAIFRFDTLKGNAITLMVTITRQPNLRIYKVPFFQRQVIQFTFC